MLPPGTQAGDSVPVDDPGSGHFRLARQLLDEVGRYQPAGSLLDIGCGFGHLLRLALDRDYDAVGLDASLAAAEFAQAAFGVEPIVGFFPGHEFEAGSFDVVVMNHVLEHLPEPRSALSEVARALKPGGILAVGAPDFDSLVCRIRGAMWQGIQPSQHVWQLSTRSILELAKAAGLTAVAVRRGNLEYPRGPRRLPKWLVLRSVLAVASLVGMGDNAIILARK